MGHRELNCKEREQIAICKAKGFSHREIAEMLERDRRTIDREVKRNVFNDQYFGSLAHDLASFRKQDAAKRQKLKNDHVRSYVEDKLKQHWSPQIISGRISIDFPGFSVSHESIYQYIYNEAWELHTYLPREHTWRKKRKRYNKRKSRLANRVFIKHREEAINKRKAFGHWESDSIVGYARKGHLNVVVERKSRFTQISKLINSKADSTLHAITNRLARLPNTACRSITYDNGPENAQHESINSILNTKSFFCSPYSSWEKGTVENTNGLIRWFLPKKTDLSQVTEERIKEIETWLNNRPRKCLDFMTPKEVFNSLSGATAS